ncbi:MAG: efflux RND transporter periplasmic adaptor subunit [bacterium]
MKRALSLFIFLSYGLVLSNCSEHTAANNSETPKGIPVRTIMLEPTPFKEYLNITGTVKARNQIQIIAEEGGTLTRILKDKGSYAQKGDTLALLENQVLKAQFKEAVAALHQAELTMKSNSTLWGQKAISENDYLAAKYGCERAMAAADLAEARYGKLFITTRIPGYVNDRYFDLGSYLKPMSSLFEFVDNDVLKINAGIAERFLSDIHIGTSAVITFDAFPDIKISSSVSFVSRSIDPSSRTFQIEIAIDNPGGKLAPQMIANIKILRRFLENQIVIPADAFLESEEGRYVFINSNDRAEMVKISIEAVYEDKVAVDGLQPNQELIFVGQQELSDGDLLNVVKD